MKLNLSLKGPSLIIFLVLAVILLHLPYGGFMAGIMLLPLISYSLGVIGLSILATYLILLRITDILGVTIISLGLLLLEMREMERIKAPGYSYLFLLLAIILGFLAYGTIYAIGLLGIGIEVTLGAIIFALFLYAFIRSSLLTP
ncbi:hypothetical protein [Pyrococcus abyssi]|uniref:Uncharacterized protein n=1 Tax=Pyrococcus abyssi (strain GE5 / Orsay) TaxID=272844 RepID=Q9UZ65_PYRAB|nr:hypothetical protein [Pyrococcus abyssi]CAB50194.1 Hypothetical protein PAB0850 [Pyrococcus abyssi GE5]CCE70728.1 TPA: hypothetical protein PAB0850 [Pyrococcus abyssi GE5]